MTPPLPCPTLYQPAREHSPSLLSARLRRSIRNGVTVPCGAATRLGDAPQWAKQRETTRHLQLQGRRCKSAGEKAASPSDLEEFKRILKTQLLINLNDTKGAPPLHQASKEDHRNRHLEPPLHSFRSPRCVGRGEGAPRQRGGCLHGGGWRQGQSGNSEASKIKVA